MNTTTTTTTTTTRVNTFKATASDRAAFIEGKASDRANAAAITTILEVVSNYAAGHPTYRKLVENGTHNPACPLQTAMVNARGKVKSIVTHALTVAKSKRFTDQGAHDAFIDSTRLEMLDILTPAPSTKAPTVNWKARAEAAEAALQLLQAQHAALLVDYEKAANAPHITAALAPM